MDQKEFEEQFGEMGTSVERDLIWAVVSARRALQTFHLEFDLNETSLKPERRELWPAFRQIEDEAKIALAALWQHREG